MQFQQAALTFSPPAHAPSCVVRAGLTLRELVETRDLEDSRYLLVSTDEGRLAGIVNAAEILRYVTCENDVERNRWLAKTVESFIPLSFHASWPKPANEYGNAAAIDSGWARKLSAALAGESIEFLADSDDVFVPWSQIEIVLQNLASDPLTGLCTRSVFDRMLGQEVARSQRQSCPVALLLFDLDQLKRINDEQGHAEGDRALRLLARTISENLRSYDIVARYAGDEFASICFDCGADQVEHPVKRILTAMKDVRLTNGDSLSVSIGVALTLDPNRLDSVSEMFDLADECLYRAKRGGRNRAYLGFMDHDEVKELVVDDDDPELSVAIGDPSLQDA